MRINMCDYTQLTIQTLPYHLSILSNILLQNWIIEIKFNKISVLCKIKKKNMLQGDK